MGSLQPGLLLLALVLSVAVLAPRSSGGCYAGSHLQGQLRPPARCAVSNHAEATQANGLPEEPMVGEQDLNPHALRTSRLRGSTCGRRRSLMPWLGLLGCACAGCAVARRADAMATLLQPPAEQLQLYDKPRDKEFDARFAQGMAYGMVDYERAVSKKKRELFERVFAGLPSQGAVIVDVGMGSFPNALYFGSKTAPSGMDLVGVDPNDSMESYARENAQKVGLLSPDKGNTLRCVHGVAEALPLPTGVADAVICTLTLCSVVEPKQAVAEIKRVLKSGGQFLFLEHVLSETNPFFAAMQKEATPGQVRRADGCHLNRRTLKTIQAGGFTSVEGEYFELDSFNYLNPTVAGIAVA